MPDWTKNIVMLAAAIGVGVIGTGLTHAELSVDPSGASVNTLVLGSVVDDPNPIGFWHQYRAVAPNRVLNAGGHARGDGRPDIAHRDNAWPVAAWAYNAGSDYDIAVSEWDGTRWTATTFLTSSADDERDPRVVVELDGTIHVAWWSAGASDEIYAATRQPGAANWSPAVLVTAGSETGRRPAVAVVGGDLLVAYERDAVSPGMAHDIVVATLRPGVGSIFEVIGATARTGALDVMLHAEHGHLWADWKHGAGEFGYAEHRSDTGWGGSTPEPWADPTWVGIEQTRREIRGRVLE